MRRLATLALITLTLLLGCSEGERADAPETGATKVVFFGVDSANWNVLRPMIEEGQLPTIAKLVSDGSFGILESGEPIQSPQMWTSIATGVVPERHGITRFTAKVEGGDREVPVTSNMRKVKAFWNILSENDVTVGVVAWWPSWPAEEVNGFVIAQRAWPVNWSQHGIPWGAERDRYGRLVVEEFPGRTYPEELYEEFVPFITTEEDVTTEQLDMFFADSRFADPEEEFNARWAFAKDKSFAEAGLHFLLKYEPEVFAIYFQGTDVVSHYYWGYQKEEGFDVEPIAGRMYGGIVRNYYKFIDKVMADYIDAVGDDCAVIFVSDHGFETKQDLKVRWERGEEIRTVEGNYDVPWDHGLDGAFIVSGPGIKSGYRAADASVMDITPTLLAYLGLPTARDMDGKPMADVFEPGFLADNPIGYVDTYETGETRGDEAPMESPMDEGLKEKLRALGYIE